MEDLWPEQIGEEKFNAPVSIMRTQAELLGEKTRNLVTADVSAGQSGDSIFVYHFFIVGPTLNNYHFRLFTVQHDIEMYPLDIYVDEVLGDELGILPRTAKAKTLVEVSQEMTISILGATGTATSSEPRIIMSSTEDDFVAKLRKILNSRRSRQVISSLLSQIDPSDEPLPF